jgi:hypothetical protein
VGATVLASIFSQSQKSISKQSTGKAEAIKKIAKNTTALYQQLDQAALRISTAVQRLKDLTENNARSPRAVKTIKDLEAAITMFTPSKPTVDYEISGYAMGNRRWRHSPFQHPTSTQDLLLEDIRGCQEKNQLLGEKIEQIVLRNNMLAQQASSIYNTPSEKLKKSPTLNILTKKVATYMFLKNMNNPREVNKV